jgi:hypothetical protein
VNRLGRFGESEILRHIFERVVAACMVAALVKGERFAVDASVTEANASRYHGMYISTIFRVASSIQSILSKSAIRSPTS